MDTSASKALIMVASVLLAMMVIALVTFTFNRVGTWAGSENEQEEAEQREAFNKEFEAYDKRLMYGLDVISCLNKIIDNNKKLTEHGRVNGNQYDDVYEVRATLQMKKTQLDESITVYHMNKIGGKYKEVAYTDATNASGLGTLGSMDDKFAFLSTNYKSNFEEHTQLETLNGEVSINKWTIDKDSDANNNDLLKLLSVSGTISETVKNKNGNPEEWTKAEFRSALYDFKKRKFKCAGITYNSTTGRVNGMTFEEL